jgi:3-methyladenine DNA glycosylase Tag
VKETKDGWLKLAAYGFTFSSPTISVKLSQAKATVVKSTTITCVKGKTSKKVTGKSPKCPAGFKKK